MEGKVRESVCGKAGDDGGGGGLPWQVREMHTQVRSRDFLLKRSNRQGQVPGCSSLEEGGHLSV